MLQYYTTHKSELTCGEGRRHGEGVGIEKHTIHIEILMVVGITDVWYKA